MRYVDNPISEPQRRPLVPNKLISGMLPGATQIRIGGDSGILIDGKTRTLSVSDDNTIVKMGKVTTTTLGLGLTDASGILRFLAGTYPDGTVKVKLSADGKDVSVAENNDLVWSSDFKTFKITESDTVTTDTESCISGDYVDVDTMVNFTKTYSVPPLVLAFKVGGTLIRPSVFWASEAINPLSYTVGAGTGITIQTAEIRSISTSTTQMAIRTTFLNGSAGILTSPSYNVKYYVLTETSS